MKHLLLTLLLGLLAFNTIGCKQDPMQLSRAAIAKEDPDGAEKALKQALAKEPTNLEAKRLMAEVHRLRGDYEQAEKALDEIWDPKGFINGAAPRSPEEKLLRKLMKQQYAELYREWLDKLDVKEEPALYRQIIENGLEKNPKSNVLNSKGVDFYMAKAERHLEKGDKRDAAEAFEQVLSFRTLPGQRTMAEDKALALRKDIYVTQVQERFHQHLKPDLVKEDRWNEEKQSVKIKIENIFDDKIDQKNEAEMKVVDSSTKKVIHQGLVATVMELTGVPTNESVLKTLGAPKYEAEEMVIKRNIVTVNVWMSINDAIDYSFTVAEALRKNKIKEAEGVDLNVAGAQPPAANPPSETPPPEKEKAKPEGSAQ